MERHRPEDQEAELTSPLAGFAVRDTGATHVTRVAARLLCALGAREHADTSPAARVLVLRGGEDHDPVDDWAASGGMALTGEPNGPGRPVPGPVTTGLRGAAQAVAVLSEHIGRRVDLDGPALVGERAAIAGLSRHGSVSPGGSCRLLPARDGWLACNLARPDDFAMLPALTRRDVGGDPWGVLAAWARNVSATEIVERAALLGLPFARVATPQEAALEDGVVRGDGGSIDPWIVTPGPLRARDGRPFVVDLSALWAGPLCASIVAEAGADVVKVESPTRPDGARRGPRAFFDLMNAGKRSVCIDLRSDALRVLLARADVVVESARPRVMEHLGIEPAALVRDAGVVWVSITGYGRTGPRRDRAAFGDDAAAAGGACAVIGDDGGPPLICADAFADPVSGLHAALAALACLAGGRGALVDVALRRGGTSLLTGAGSRRAGRPRPGIVASPPRARTPRGRGPELGADTETVLAQVGVAERPCRVGHST
ncbi:MAG: CoA transferase [Actinobacteria bacterium]|nr:CoA transferase [Actinomycetota bacterium]